MEAYKDQQIDFANRNSPSLFAKVLEVPEIEERLKAEREARADESKKSSKLKWHSDVGKGKNIISQVT